MKRNGHTPEEKTVMVIEVIKGGKTLNEIASENGVHPGMLSKWKKEAVDGRPSLFRKDSAKKRKEEQEREAQPDELYTQIGKLTTQLEWLIKKSGRRTDFP